GDLAGGIDLSLPVTLGIACVLYLLLLNLFPEPAGVYGPNGPRWVRCKRTRHMPVITAEMT
ncbi:MAG TPA: cytosine permease, partial [Pseudomonas sp.]|nr:cytosine permease [Pseudomonas sp.]